LRSLFRDPSFAFYSDPRAPSPANRVPERRPLTRIIGSDPTLLKPLQQRGTDSPLGDTRSQFIRAYVERSRNCLSEAFVTGLDDAVFGEKASDALAP
jgi:hypothetical protein